MVSMSISHDRQEETLEAKARWFQSLSLSERMELLCAFTDLILASNPKIVEQKDAQPVKTRMNTQDYNEALTFAIQDLVDNWSDYDGGIRNG
jgi:hypothetical protein